MHFQSDDGIVIPKYNCHLRSCFFFVVVDLLSKFKDTMNLLGLSFIFYVLKLSSGSGF